MHCVNNKIVTKQNLQRILYGKIYVSKYKDYDISVYRKAIKLMMSTQCLNFLERFERFPLSEVYAIYFVKYDKYDICYDMRIVLCVHIIGRGWK